MSSCIVVKMKDGTSRQFLYERMENDDLTTGIRYEGSMVVIIDERGCQIGIPMSDIKEVFVPFVEPYFTHGKD